MKLNYFENTNLKDKTIIMRVDYNVPMKNGIIMDNTRIIESLSTIKTLLDHDAKIILMSHLGRPDGQIKHEFTLAPVAKELERLLQKPIIFLTDCIGENVEQTCHNLQPKQIVLLENLRFYPEEEKNVPEFAQKLGALGEIYINDAFGTAHRAHASTHGITKFLPSFAGHLIQKEVTNLSLLFEQNKHPYTLVIGGAKIDTKIDIITNFQNRADNFLIGGGIANTFLACQGRPLGGSLVEKEKIITAQEIQTNLKQLNKKLYLPTDYLVSTEISATAKTENVSQNLNEVQKILDLGSESQIQYAQVLANSQIIVWNGPMGVYEYEPFRSGTKAVAQAIKEATKNGAISILGGGDTIDALKILGFSFQDFTHVSTGGGAMLEFLEKGTLPGLEVLTAD